jgi:hypothetical protein
MDFQRSMASHNGFDFASDASTKSKDPKSA